MKYDFIEIGTSDFRTYCQTAPGRTTGLLIEPLIDYLYRLPDREGWQKVNCAIGKKEGIIKAFGVKAEKIAELGLPNWLRGCNRINSEHPTVIKYCEEHKLNLEDITYQEDVACITFERLIEEFEITAIDVLKVDTEGMDHVILDQYIKCLIGNMNLRARRIEFEANELTKPENYLPIVDQLMNLGYKVRRQKFDLIAEL